MKHKVFPLIRIQLSARAIKNNPQIINITLVKKVILNQNKMKFSHREIIIKDQFQWAAPDYRSTILRNNEGEIKCWEWKTLPAKDGIKENTAYPKHKFSSPFKRILEKRLWISLFPQIAWLLIANCERWVITLKFHFHW